MIDNPTPPKRAKQVRKELSNAINTVRENQNGYILAFQLYTIHHLTSDEICSIIGSPPVVVNTWINVYNWNEVKTIYSFSNDTNIQEMVAGLLKDIKTIDKGDDLAITKKKIDVLNSSIDAVAKSPMMQAKMAMANAFESIKAGILSEFVEMTNQERLLRSNIAKCLDKEQVSFYEAELLKIEEDKVLNYKMYLKISETALNYFDQKRIKK